MPNNIIKPEILIIGAGPGGSSAAWKLAIQGYEVLLIDKAKFPRDKTCGDAISPLAVERMEEMGVLAAVEKAGAQKVHSASIIGYDGTKATADFDDFLKYKHPYGLAMPRHKFDHILLQHAINAGAAYREAYNVKDIKRVGDRILAVQVSTPQGKLEIQAVHTIIAVGANIGLLRRTGFLNPNARFIKASRAYYEIGETFPSSYEFFYERDLIPGYGWIFPVGNGLVNIGAGTWNPKKNSSKLLEKFLGILIAKNLIDSPKIKDKIKSYPLRIDFPSQKLDGENWMLVGESAGLVNPLSGEGIDLAIESGLTAGDQVIRNYTSGISYHHTYQKTLEGQYKKMFRGMNLVRNIGINRVFLPRLLRVLKEKPELFHIFLKVSLGLTPPKKLINSQWLSGMLGF